MVSHPRRHDLPARGRQNAGRRYNGPIPDENDPLSERQTAHYQKLGGLLLVMFLVLAACAIAHSFAASAALSVLYGVSSAARFEQLLLLLFNIFAATLQATACVLILRRAKLMFGFYMFTSLFCLLFLILLVSLPSGLRAQHSAIVASFFACFVFAIYLCCSRRADVYFGYYYLVKKPEVPPLAASAAAGDASGISVSENTFMQDDAQPAVKEQRYVL